MKRSFSIRRVLAATLLVIAVAAGIAWYMGLFLMPAASRPANSIAVLMPYRHAGTWVFDDPAVGLRREPFVAGIPEMMDQLVEDIPDADRLWPKAIITVAWGNAPGMVCVWRLVWPKAIFTRSVGGNG